MDTRDSGAVGSDIPCETPLVSQNICQQHLVRRTGQTAVRVFVTLIVRIHLRRVDRERVIRRHQRLDIRLFHRCLKRGQIVLAHVLFCNERSGTLTTCLVVISGKVLGAGYYLEIVRSACAVEVSTLKSTDERYRQFACQERVFAVVLFLTTPTRVTRHIDRRRPVVQTFVRVQMVTTCFIGSHTRAFVHQFAVPCRRHTFALREGRSSTRTSHTVDSLIPVLICRQDDYRSDSTGVTGDVFGDIVTQLIHFFTQRQFVAEQHGTFMKGLGGV